MSYPSSSPKSPLHIVAAGGCHLYGWPIGDSHSFLRVAQAATGPAELTTIAPINLQHYAPLTAHLQQQPTDVLILQLGNYETLASIKKHVHTLLRPGRRSRFAASRPSSIRRESYDTAPLEPDTTFRPTASWRLRVLWKQIYSTTLGHWRPLLFDRTKLERNYERLISELLHSPSSAPGLIVVIAPIPCADPLIRRCRLQASKILDRLCDTLSKQHPDRVLFLDTARALGVDAQTDLTSPDSVFADDLHLNRRGHLALGSALAALIQGHLAANMEAIAHKDESGCSLNAVLEAASCVTPEHLAIIQQPA